MLLLKHHEATDNKRHQHPVAYDLSYNEGTAVLPGFVWKDSIGDGINAAII